MDRLSTPPPPSPIDSLALLTLTPVLQPSLWYSQGSALSDLLLYPTQLFRTRLTHPPDEGGSLLI